MVISYWLTYLFLFRIVLTVQYKSIEAIEDDFYHKVIEANCTEAVARRCSIKKVFLRPAILLKKRLWHRCFPVNFEKFLRTPFLTEHLRRLLIMETSNVRQDILLKRKRVWRFFVNKNFYIKGIINNGEKEKIIVSTKYFFFMFLKHAQRITEVAARRCFVRRLLLKHFNWY